MAGRQVLAEGSSINRPPAFNGENYDFWKIRMRIFIEAQDLDIWNAVETGPYVPYDVIEGKTIIKTKEQWNMTDKHHVQADLKAKNILMSALGPDEFFRVSNCKSAKEMWDTLQITHEGTHEVKRSRLNALSQEYEMFRMVQGESVVDLQRRFTHLINHLQSLGKEYSPAELNMKVLRSLTREWQPKVTAISEKKSLSTMPLAALFGKLQEHELELSRLEKIEESEKGRSRTIALKTNNQAAESSDSSSDEEMNMLAKKFSKFLKKNRGKKSLKFKKGDSNSSITCFECGKPGHIRSECPDLKKNKKKKSAKPKKAYIAWEDNDSTATSSSSDPEEQANLCLMADEESEVKYFSDSKSTSSNSIASSSTSSFDFDTLQNAFKELLDESIKIGKENNMLKAENNFLVSKNTEIKQELELLKIQLEVMDNLDRIEKPCENCPRLQTEIEKLNKTVNMYSKHAKENYENSSFVLNAFKRSQRKFGDRRGLGYEFKTKGPAKAEKKNTLKSVFIKARKGPVCTYCSKPGHINTRCYIKLYEVPQGRCKWVAKCSTHLTDQNGPNCTWVPH